MIISKLYWVDRRFITNALQVCNERLQLGYG